MDPPSTPRGSIDVPPSGERAGDPTGCGDSYRAGPLWQGADWDWAMAQLASFWMIKIDKLAADHRRRAPTRPNSPRPTGPVKSTARTSASALPGAACSGTHRGDADPAALFPRASSRGGARWWAGGRSWCHHGAPTRVTGALPDPCRERLHDSRDHVSGSTSRDLERRTTHFSPERDPRLADGGLISALGHDLHPPRAPAGHGANDACRGAARAMAVPISRGTTTEGDTAQSLVAFDPRS